MHNKVTIKQQEQEREPYSLEQGTLFEHKTTGTVYFTGCVEDIHTFRLFSVESGDIWMRDRPGHTDPRLRPLPPGTVVEVVVGGEGE